MTAEAAPSQAEQLKYGGHGQLMAALAADSVAERFSHHTLEGTHLDRSEACYHDVVGADLLGRGLTADPGPTPCCR